MTVRVTVTYKSPGQEVVYELAADAGYSPDVADDIAARVRSEFIGAIAAVKVATR